MTRKKSLNGLLLFLVSLVFCLPVAVAMLPGENDPENAPLLKQPPNSVKPGIQGGPQQVAQPRVNETFKQWITQTARTHPFKVAGLIGLIGSGGFALYGLYYEHQVKPLLEMKDKISKKEQKRYNPLFLHAVQNAKFYQTKLHVFSKNKDTTLQESNSLRNDIDRALNEILQEKRLLKQARTWFFRPNVLKNEINEILQEQEGKLSIAHSLMKASEHVINDGFGRTEIEIDEAIQKMKEFKNETPRGKPRGISLGQAPPYKLNSDDKMKLFGEALAVSLNIKSVSKSRKAYITEENLEAYIKGLSTLIEDLTESLKHDHRNLYTYLNLSWLKLERARYSKVPERNQLEDEAKKHIDHALDIDSKDPAVLYADGLFWMRKGDYHRDQNYRNYYVNAYNLFSEASKKDEKNAEILRNLAAISIRREGRAKDAYNYAHQADTLCPGDCDILTQLIIAAACTSRCEEAREKLEFGTCLNAWKTKLEWSMLRGKET